MAETAVTEPRLARLVAFLVALLAIRVGLEGWLTASESMALFVRLLPAAGAVAVVAFRSAAAPQLRWTAAALAAGLPLVLGFQILTPEADSTERRFGLWTAEAHGGVGQYQEADICDTDLYKYQTAGAGIAHVTVDLDKDLTRELGLRVYGAKQQRADEPEGSPQFEEDGVGTLVAHPYVQVEGRYYGGHLGAQIGQAAYLDADATSPILPSLGFRVGPRSFHLQGGILDGPQFGSPAPAIHVGLGTGRLTASGQELRLQGGFSGSGVYASGTLPADRFLFEPMAAYAPTDNGAGLSRRPAAPLPDPGGVRRQRPLAMP